MRALFESECSKKGRMAANQPGALLHNEFAFATTLFYGKFRLDSHSWHF